MTGESPLRSEESEPRPRFWYEPTEAPIGGDWPAQIKSQWIGTRLAVKGEEDIIPPKALLPEDPELLTTVARAGFVKIEVQDAVSCLRIDGKNDAADFWTATAKALKWPGTEGLYFRLDQGRLVDSDTEEEVQIALIPFADDELQNS